MISSDTDGRVYANVYRDLSGNKGDNLNERIELSSCVENKLETVKSGDEMRVGPVILSLVRQWVSSENQSIKLGLGR
jgi:hypothetical protein